MGVFTDDRKRVERDHEFFTVFLLLSPAKNAEHGLRHFFLCLCLFFRFKTPRTGSEIFSCLFGVFSGLKRDMQGDEYGIGFDLCAPSHITKKELRSLLLGISVHLRVQRTPEKSRLRK